MFDSFHHSDSYNSYVPVVDPVNCSLLGLLNSGNPDGSKDILPLCAALWKLPQGPLRSTLASTGSGPFPQEWLFFTASCLAWSEWWFPFWFLVDSIKRINSTSLTLCWSEVGVLFSLSSTIGYPWFTIKPYQIYYV